MKPEQTPSSALAAKAKFLPQPQSLWLISLEAQAGFFAALPEALRAAIKPVTLRAALERGTPHPPALILLEGKPGRAVRDVLARLKARLPGAEVFVVSRWSGGAEMQTWFSRLIFEFARPPKPTVVEAPNPYGLSKRELEILRLMAKGLIKKEIAEFLSISYFTVDNHERSIARKMKIHSRTAAVAKALMEKILPVEETNSTDPRS